METNTAAVQADCAHSVHVGSLTSVEKAGVAWVAWGLWTMRVSNMLRKNGSQSDSVEVEHHAQPEAGYALTSWQHAASLALRAPIQEGYLLKLAPHYDAEARQLSSITEKGCVHYLFGVPKNRKSCVSVLQRHELEPALFIWGMGKVPRFLQEVAGQSDMTLGHIGLFLLSKNSRLSAP